MIILPYRPGMPSLIHGRGVFATQFIPQGTLLPIWYAAGHGFNHSCDPNVSSRAEDATRANPTRMALRDILPGEELTLSYGYTPDNCNCPICREKI